jgi:hypothetical protein
VTFQHATGVVNDERRSFARAAALPCLYALHGGLPSPISVIDGSH